LLKERPRSNLSDVAKQFVEKRRFVETLYVIDRARRVKLSHHLRVVARNHVPTGCLNQPLAQLTHQRFAARPAPLHLSFSELWKSFSAMHVVEKSHKVGINLHRYSESQVV